MATYKIGYYIAGICLEVVATVTQNVGLNLQKLAHRTQLRNLQQRDPEAFYQKRYSTPNYCANGAWWIAILVFITGVILDFVALAFIPATVSLPVGSLGLIVSAICAKMWLNERIFPIDYVGIVMVVAGTWFIIGFSNKSITLMTVATLRTIFTVKDPGLWFFVGSFAVLIAAIILSMLWKNAVTYGIVPGLIGIFTILLGGCVGQMTLNTINGSNQMNQYEYWLCLGGLVVAVLLLNHFLQRANSQYDNTIIIPIYFTTILITTILSGIWFFKYFATITVLEGSMFGVGVVLIVIGCFLLAINHVKREDPYTGVIKKLQGNVADVQVSSVLVSDLEPVEVKTLV